MFGKTYLKQPQSITVQFSLCKCFHRWQKGIKRHIYNLNASLVIEDSFFQTDVDQICPLHYNAETTQAFANAGVYIKS